MKPIRRIIAFLDFLVFYLGKLVLANLYIAYDILTPAMRISPRFVEVPLRVHTSFGILLISNLVSMTPGTLTTGISEDRKTLKIHVLYGKDNEKVLNEVRAIQEKVIRITG